VLGDQLHVVQRLPALQPAHLSAHRGDAEARRDPAPSPSPCLCSPACRLSHPGDASCSVKVTPLSRNAFRGPLRVAAAGAKSAGRCTHALNMQAGDWSRCDFAEFTMSGTDISKSNADFARFSFAVLVGLLGSETSFRGVRHPSSWSLLGAPTGTPTATLGSLPDSSTPTHLHTRPCGGASTGSTPPPRRSLLRGGDRAAGGLQQRRLDRRLPHRSRPAGRPTSRTVTRLPLGCLSAASRLPLGCLSAASRLPLGCLSAASRLLGCV